MIERTVRSIRFAPGAVLIACVLALTGCGGEAADEEVPAPFPFPVEGVAVVVETAEGYLAPGLFEGTRDEADRRSEGTFRFSEGETGIFVVPAGRQWMPEGSDPGDGEPQGELVVLVHGDDGDVTPGGFRGPPALAVEVARLLVTHLGLDRDAGPAVIDVNTRHSRTRVYPPCSTVRIVD
jgi:hypothetical protein